MLLSYVTIICKRLHLLLNGTILNYDTALTIWYREFSHDVTYGSHAGVINQQ